MMKRREHKDGDSNERRSKQFYGRRRSLAEPEGNPIGNRETGEQTRRSIQGNAERILATVQIDQRSKPAQKRV
jgi:hypothetical protein